MENALTNEVVLSNLFSFLKLDVLQKCKLVNKLWNKNANIWIRKEKRINLSFQDSFYGRREKAIKFLADMSNTLELPFGKFNLIRLDFERYSDSSPSLTQQFLNFHGPRIRSLQFSLNDFLDVMKMQESLPWFITCLPNLQILELVCHKKVPLNEHIFPNNFPIEKAVFPKLTKIVLNVGGVDITNKAKEEEAGFVDNSNILFQDLLNMTNRLETFSMSWNYSCYTESYEPILPPPLLHMLNQPPCIHLRNLRLHCPVSEEDLKTLNSFDDLQLTSLVLGRIQIDVKKSSLEKLLFSQRKTLRNLLLGEPEEDRNTQENAIVLEFPCMESLTTLTVIRHGYRPPRKLLFCANAFKHSFPNLVKLDISEVNHNWDTFLPNAFEEHRALTTLLLPYGFSDPNVMEIVLKTFPNLKHLKLQNVTAEVLRALWRFGSQLEELKLQLLSFDHRIDSVLTGIPHRICQWIVEKRAYSRVDENFFEVVERADASLASLTKLKRLYLCYEIESDYYEDYITDATGYFAISKLTELTSLKLNSNKITNECQQYIRSQCRNIRDIRARSYNGSYWWAPPDA